MSINLEYLVNIHDGKRAFIVGNGPSLADTDVSKLKDDIVFGCNRINLGYEKWELYFPYWCIEDVRLAADTATEWNDIPASIKFVPSELDHLITDTSNVCTFYIERTPKYRKNRGESFYWPGFSFEPDVIYSGYSVVYTMIQIAFIMGCNPLYLIGMDHNYTRVMDKVDGISSRLISTGPDPDHFDPQYFGEGAKFHVPRTDLSSLSFERADLAARERGLKIYNASIWSRLEAFERIDYGSLFQT